MEDTGKLTKLLDLGTLRRETDPNTHCAARAVPYRGVGDPRYHNGVYESSFVSPFTKGARNVDAPVFLVLQDWSSDDSLSGSYCKDSEVVGRSLSGRVVTNVRLEKLLKDHFGTGISDTFGTNVFPYVKPGSMSTSIPASDLVWAARTFTLPQIRVVQPKVVLCFGLATFRAVQVAAGEPASNSLPEAIQAPFHLDGIRVACLAHPGHWGTQVRNKLNKGQVVADWQAVAAAV